MLKSTHKPAAGPPSAAAPPPLPPGWTEHPAPTGHTYYYHAATNRSTYTRPLPLPQPVQAQSTPIARQGLDGPDGQLQPPTTIFIGQQQRFVGYRDDQRKRDQHDRPKHKQTIPGCSPWLLVKTKLGRRFVYNPELGESFWKFPPEVMKCVVELDRIERERRQRGENVTQAAEEGHAPLKSTENAAYDSDEYEEVEITEDEDEENAPNKRAKLDEDRPLEFNEDDIAYQLAAMGQEDDGFDEEGYEEPPLDEADAIALFRDLLDDYHINPYTPWESLIEDGKIIEDERYTCLPNSKSRKEAWSVWTRDTMRKLKEEREQQEKKDPRVSYLAFLQQSATAKLYWPEFRRKYQKQPEMSKSKLPTKDQEKLYRDYINRLKYPEDTLKGDLRTLLMSQSIYILNNSTTLETLPSADLVDLRYISHRPSVRDPLIEGFISLLPAAPNRLEGISPEEETALQKRKEDRERREKALAGRERWVREEKRRQAGTLRYSKGMLKEEEDEVRRALKVGREGLLKHLETTETGVKG